MQTVVEPNLDHPDTDGDLISLDALLSGGGGPENGLEISIKTDPRDVAPHFQSVSLIAIAVSSFGDGHGFALARRLRSLGYTGWLRAKGHMTADLYPTALVCGFDEVKADPTAVRWQPNMHLQAAAAISRPAEQAGV